MRFRVAISLFVLGWFHGLCAGAEEQKVELPKDGWWIRYVSKTKQESDEQVQEYTCKATYSLVGTMMEGGETCRWVEINSVCSWGEKEHVVSTKLLVPEKDLLEREQPLDALKRAWIKVNKGDLREIKVGQGIRDGNTHLMIFPGMWQKGERVEEERVVDYQQGRLKISEAKSLKVTKTVTTLVRGKSEDRNLDKEYTVWFDRTTSPAFSAAKIKTKIYANGKLRSTQDDDLFVEDYGTDAKTQLPDNN